MSFDGINATVREWDELPSEVITPPAACAVLVCAGSAPAKLFVNDTVTCDHEHLKRDAEHLVAAFGSGDIDSAWGSLDNGDRYTVILTREVAATLSGGTAAEIDP